MRDAMNALLTVAVCACCVSCAGTEASSELASAPGSASASATPPRSVLRPQSAVEVQIGEVSLDQMRQTASWAHAHNLNVVLGDSLLIWPRVGEADSAAITTAGRLRIVGFRDIQTIADVDRYYETYLLVTQQLRQGSGGALPTIDPGTAWDENLVVFAGRADIYKRLVVSDFAETYNLRVPAFPPGVEVTEGLWRLRARYSFFVGQSYVDFLWGANSLLRLTVPMANAQNCQRAMCTQVLNVRDRCSYGSWPLKVAGSHLTRVVRSQMGADAGPRNRMTLEFVLSGPAEANFILTDQNNVNPQQSLSNRRFEAD